MALTTYIKLHFFGLQGTILVRLFSRPRQKQSYFLRVLRYALFVFPKTVFYCCFCRYYFYIKPPLVCHVVENGFMFWIIRIIISVNLITFPFQNYSFSVGSDGSLFVFLYAVLYYLFFVGCCSGSNLRNRKIHRIDACFVDWHLRCSAVVDICIFAAEQNLNESVCRKKRSKSLVAFFFYDLLFLEYVLKY